MKRFPERNVVFVHIPKTAGQAVVAAFGLTHEPSDHDIAGPDQEALLAPDLIRFCVVRNPFKRFVSAYRYSVFMCSKRPELPERQFILKHGLDKNVNTFIEKLVELDFDILKRPHFRRQKFFVTKTRPKIILRFENLEADLQIIRRLVPDLWVGLAPVNVSDDRVSLRKIRTDLSAASKDYLKKLYEEDFTLFAY